MKADPKVIVSKSNENWFRHKILIMPDEFTRG